MRDSLPWMVINRRAEFYAASFILGGGIRNVQIHKKQTVTNILTTCILACVYNKTSGNWLTQV